MDDEKISKKLERVSYIREAFMVRRYHTVPHVAIEDTVGNHTANVISFLFFLFDENPPLYLIRAALHHDVPEVSTGDIPAPVKWANPKLAEELQKIEKAMVVKLGLEGDVADPLHLALLKYADMMDLCFKAIEEMAAGNEVFQPIASNGLSAILNLLQGPLKDHEPAKELFFLLRTNVFINVDVFLKVEEPSNVEIVTKH